MTQLPLSAFIEADVSLLSADDGGRLSAIGSGYRCNCWVGDLDGAERTYHDATFYLLEVDELSPGSTARARVEPHYPDDWSHLDVGSTFELREGARLIGLATITDLFPAP